MKRARPSAVATADVCDVAESCDGASNDCPADQFEPSTVECRAGADVCDVAESCTGSGAACPADGFEPATTVCRPSAHDCDATENCSGGGAACPADDPVPDGTTCDDTNMCTLDDMCVAGACIGDSMLCGDTVLQDGCGEECDDGNLDAGDGCSPTCLVEPGLACTTAPLSGCRRPFVPGKASIKMLKKSTPDKDSIKWKWLKGERTTLLEYGDPLTSTNYQVCIYDVSGRRFEITVPAGGTCGDQAVLEGGRVERLQVQGQGVDARRRAEARSSRKARSRRRRSSSAPAAARSRCPISRR